MSNLKSKITSSFAVIGLLVFADTASAKDLEDLGLEHEVNACVAEVRDHANFEDAVRVRHDIVAIERRTVGYTMNITTSVYSDAADDAIRAYATTCVVNGNNKPMKFSISEKS